MPDMTESSGIQIGDAVLNFVADMTKLDQGFESLEARVTSSVNNISDKFTGFDDVVDKSKDVFDDTFSSLDNHIQDTEVNLREARGEAMLLGEAFGVHLPRHVSSFLATLPGVGEALESAFAATAVLFIIEAVIKLTEKITEFVSSTMIYTDAMKAADAATAALNAEIITQEKALATAKQGFDNVGKSATELARINIAENLKEQLAAIDKALADSNGKLQQQEAWWKRAGFAVTDWMGVTTHALDEEARKEQETLNNRTQANKAAELAKQAAAEQTATVVREAALAEDKAREANMATFNKLMLEQRNYAGELIRETNAMMDAIAKLPTASHNFEQFAVDLNAVRDSMTKGQDAAAGLGITLRTDLVQNLTVATRALQEFQASGIKDDTALAQFQQRVKDAAKELQNYGVTSEKTTTELISQGVQLKKNKDDWQALSAAYGTAAADAIIAGQGFGKAIEQATEQELAAISRKAMVQAIYYTGLGFAALAGFNYTSAGQYFEAAGILGAIAVGTGLGASAMGGSSAGVSSGASVGTTQPVQTTGSAPNQTAVQRTNTQSFASGGLISAPTMAVLGDSPSGPEAVLPLGDEAAMRQIADAVVSRMGSGLNEGASHTFNGTFFGNLSNSDVKKLTRKISQAVNNGTATLHATRTGRIVKKSA